LDHEEGADAEGHDSHAHEVQLDVVQTRLDVRGELKPESGFVDTLRLRAGYADYQHDELEDGGEIVCIDTWGGGDEHTPEDMAGAEERFHQNITLVRSNFPNRAVVSFRCTSVEGLAGLLAHKKQFDFIYIDGSHIAKDVLTDACMAWPLLKDKGFMVFDDYMWRPPGFTVLQRPKIAVDTFINMYEDELIVTHIGYQLIVRKEK
jgi:hypothetical protein